ncbi:quinone-dependent dihydroorotate dehydrogenase [Salinarchaeum sp. IM2453]|uniref:quinone-dependent dihydroorotate dehydrogenase n=1 Tax=Salinarchaeum sp. IM2453 TaxID=2862870 RepID=UPI001C833B17|nr:quinone-dependent dihydroorotate dehydrogenase [Salinarchaeum sp. IM2453]QZA87539.1 quinone-dependent dihydroorotate dehydrogenase [Salinarchaeum sp. IM2453]
MGVYDILKPILFRLPPETAHETALTGLKTIQDTPIESVLRSRFCVDDSRLTVSTLDQTFPNPVGLAAGFDKNATAPGSLSALGFGHIELGAVTAESQPGNPKPRLFRLPEDEALINRMGFNNAGADEIGDRLDTLSLPDIPLGVNLGKSKTTPLSEAPDDYAYSFNRVADAGDFFVVNVSSPNTPGLRSLQDRGPLVDILSRLQDEGADPLLVKLSPDLTKEATDDALDVVNELGLDGVVAVNTTTERPNRLQHPNQVESGGLSGAPLNTRATERIQYVAERVDVPVIGVGGIASAEDAYQKLRAGADIVQLYTGFVYEGPTVARQINRGLLEYLDRDGYDSVEDVIGVDLE